MIFWNIVDIKDTLCFGQSKIELKDTSTDQTVMVCFSYQIIFFDFVYQLRRWNNMPSLAVNQTVHI